jgi:hypothetical protein
MAGELAERLRPTLEEWERGNFAAGADVLAPDVHVEWFTADGIVVSDGWDQVGTQLREVFEQWADYRIGVGRVEEIGGDVAVMQGSQHGLGKRSGVRVDESLTIVFRFAGDRVAEMFWHPERSDALRAAGISE